MRYVISRMPLGAYDLETAVKIRERFNQERDKTKERAKGRRNQHVLFRANGHRNLYTKTKEDFKSIQCGNGDIPLKYAQEVRLYLVTYGEKVDLTIDKDGCSVKL
jgi:hypothetical protein